MGDRSFDTVVASQVRKHQKPERVEQVIAEMLRVGERVIIIASWGHDRPRGRRTHAYHHDYVAICGAMDCEMNRVRARYGHIYVVLDPVRGRAAAAES